MVESSAPAVAVALLFDASEGGASTRDAVAASGAHIVYEAATQGFDRAELARAHADVVVIDLHGPDEAELDRLDALAEDYRVIFNDAEVSSELSGWDRARWQRHLGAKICGGEIDPPRPEDREAVPVPVRAVAAMVASEAAAEQALSTLAPDASLDDATAAIAPPATPPATPILTEPAEPAASMATAAIDIDLPPVPDWDVELELPAGAPLESSDPPVMAAADVPDADDADLDAWVRAALEGDDSPLEVLSPEAEADEFAAAAVADDDIVAAPTDPNDGETWGLLDFDSLPEVPAAPVQGVDELVDVAPEARSNDAEAAAEALAAPEWTLDGLLDDEPPSPTASPSDFGIETVTAAEFLAPELEEDSPQPASAPAGFELELIPLEEAVAPQQASDVGHENRMEALDSAAIRVRRVWVLGASVGGPEAVREFLADLPRDYPALFLLAQHLGGEFLAIMARQLAQATPLQVRTPEHGDRVGHGDVVIVPPGKRLQVDATGAIMLRDEAADLTYSPSIDTLLQDVADRFGAAAGAIVFSGIGRDAIEGSRYLAGKGGQVWVQQPETCVVASMVEGVRDTGVASFTGSPGELAGHLLDSTP